MKSGIFAHWPNRITALRFAGSVVLFAILSVFGDRQPRPVDWVFQLVFWLFVVVAFTDVLDGWLARRGNLVTAFGRIADPFVDKVLVLGTMIYLAVLDWSDDWFPAWVVVIVLAREFLVTGIRGYIESLGSEFPADWFGKVKMIVQCVAIGTVIGVYAFPWPEVLRGLLVAFGHVLVWATLLSSLGSGLSYILKTRRILMEKAR